METVGVRIWMRNSLRMTNTNWNGGDGTSYGREYLAESQTKIGTIWLGAKKKRTLPRIT